MTRRETNAQCIRPLGHGGGPRDQRQCHVSSGEAAPVNTATCRHLRSQNVPDTIVHYHVATKHVHNYLKTIPIGNGVFHNLRYLLYELEEGGFWKYSDTIKWPQSMYLISIPIGNGVCHNSLLVIWIGGGRILKVFWYYQVATEHAIDTYSYRHMEGILTLSCDKRACTSYLIL